MGQREAFFRQRNVEPETLDIRIFITAKKGDKKFMQSIIIKSRTTTKIRKWNQFKPFI